MRIGVTGNTTKESLAEAVHRLVRITERHGLKVTLHSDLFFPLKNQYPEIAAQAQFLPADDLVAASDIIIAFGGDGTILSAARMVGRSQVPLLGVNLGKLGFMTEFSPEDLESVIADVVNGRFLTEERMLLCTAAGDGMPEVHALNDVVVDNGSSSRLIDVSVFVDGDFLIHYAGDGVILATPTGSTAYSLAAGGPIVGPTTGVIIIQPISPHSLTARTVIVPDTSTIVLRVEHSSNEARVTADGQLVKTFVPPTTFTVNKSGHTVRLLKPKDRSYYDVLRKKLFWGSDVRTMNGRNDV